MSAQGGVCLGECLNRGCLPARGVYTPYGQTDTYGNYLVIITEMGSLGHRTQAICRAFDTRYRL